MARTGRPKAENPKTKKVDVRLTEYEYARLKEYAKRHNQTLAQTLRLEARQRKLYFREYGSWIKNIFPAKI